MSKFYDLRRLFQYRELLQSLEPNQPPRGALIGPPQTFQGRAGILSGSFNPPTVAHVELARRAREAFNLDRIFFTICRLTVDKEKIEGLLLEDRVLLLSLLAEDLGWASVAVVNGGLYSEQTKAFRSLFGARARLSFIVGMDKLMQIFDPRYYEDRNTALGTLFSEAQILAAARGGLGLAELEGILRRDENAPYRDRVFPFSLRAELAELSSSALRSAIARGERVDDQLPETVRAFLSEAGAYRAAYEVRAGLLDCLYDARERVGTQIDFRNLVESARDKNKGAELLELLKSPAVSAEAVQKFIAG